MKNIIGNDFISNTPSASQSKPLTLLYFSALWCPPCVIFTEKLIDVYKLQTDFEVIFISLDKSNPDFLEYFERMPWLALPYEKQQRTKRILDHYEIIDLPSLILIDKSGHVLKKSCRRDIELMGNRAVSYWKTLCK